MIKGIGVDICDLKRLNISSESFIKKVLTKEEIDVFYNKKTDKQKLEYLGGRFAGKEALIKATNKKVSFQDITILNDESGQPIINYPNTKISISHENEYAIAFVIIE